ncbi:MULTISPECIES: hypothetical protein [Achromobacter]|uniref:hypothetical protein n=1 Tax=Achromobacter TaxID=222 RepID=UPI001EEE24D9|nr:hypothetical protein [Achromobacter ruhlandii]
MSLVKQSKKMLSESSESRWWMKFHDEHVNPVGLSYVLSVFFHPITSDALRQRDKHADFEIVER